MKKEIAIVIIIIFGLAAGMYYIGFDFSSFSFSLVDSATYVNAICSCTGQPCTDEYLYEHVFEDTAGNPRDMYKRRTPYVTQLDGTQRLYPGNDNDFFIVCDKPRWEYPDGTIPVWVSYQEGVIMDGLNTHVLVYEVADSYCSQLSVSTILANDGEIIPITINQLTCPPPPPIETCYDGIQNQDETGVDCGGVCQACYVPPPPPIEIPWIPIILVIIVIALIAAAVKYL